MKYLFTILTTPEDNEKLYEELGSQTLRRQLEQFVEQFKPELVLASTIQVAVFILINVDDPHIRLRKIIRELSRWGTVTAEPVSTLEEFYKYLEAV